MAREAQYNNLPPPYPPLKSVQCNPWWQGGCESEEQSRELQSKQTRTDLHELHHGHWIEEVQPGKAVLSGGGIGYASDLQRGSVAGKDCMSVERKMVDYRNESHLWEQSGLLWGSTHKTMLPAQISCPDPGGNQRKDTSSYKKLKSSGLVHLILKFYINLKVTCCKGILFGNLSLIIESKISPLYLY